MLQSCPPARGVYIPHLKEIAAAISEIRAAKVSIFFFYFFVFLHTCKKMQMRAPIALKFGTQKGSPKANPSIKFGAHPMNDSGVMTDYSRSAAPAFVGSCNSARILVSRLVETFDVFMPFSGRTVPSLSSKVCLFLCCITHLKLTFKPF